jgi:tetratricopeptide (TPR) repeat protein
VGRYLQTLGVVLFPPEAAFRKCIELSGGTFAAAHSGLGLILCHPK